jgi:hypothetical protein
VKQDFAKATPTADEILNNARNLVFGKKLKYSFAMGFATGVFVMLIAFRALTHYRLSEVASGKPLNKECISSDTDQKVTTLETDLIFDFYDLLKKDYPYFFNSRDIE